MTSMISLWAKKMFADLTCHWYALKTFLLRHARPCKAKGNSFKDKEVSLEACEKIIHRLLLLRYDRLQSVYTRPHEMVSCCCKT